MAKTMPKIIPLKMGDDDTVRRWYLIEDWHYWLDNIHIVIPAGFIFNGASVPRVFTAIYAPTGYLFLAALVHDYCYEYGYLREIFIEGSRTVKVKIGQRQADLMFRRISRIEYPNHKIKTEVAYRALRAFGWVAWNKSRKQDNR